MKDSQRVPGYPMRYIAAKKMDEDLEQNVEKHNLHGDGERGIPLRTAEPEDAARVGLRRKSSPLK